MKDKYIKIYIERYICPTYIYIWHIYVTVGSSYFMMHMMPWRKTSKTFENNFYQWKLQPG